MDLKKLVTLIHLRLAILVIILFSASFFWWYENKILPQEQGMEDRKKLPAKEITGDIISRNIDISKWKAYRNEKYGIEFKYPEEIFNISETVNGDGSLYLVLYQNGYSIDDYNHQIQIVLNGIKSEKEYFSESQTDTISMTVNTPMKKTGILIASTDNALMVKKKYNDFLNYGLCSLMTIYFDKTKDYRDYIIIGCEDYYGIGYIYKNIYESIYFK